MSQGRKGLRNKKNEEDVEVEENVEVDGETQQEEQEQSVAQVLQETTGITQEREENVNMTALMSLMMQINKKLEENSKEIKEDMKKMEQKLEENSRKMEQNNAKIVKRLEKQMDEKFDALEKKLASEIKDIHMERNIEIQKYNLEAKIYEERRKTEEKLDDMLQNIQTNNHQIRNVEQKIEDISQIRDIGRPYLNLTNETGIKFSGNIKNLHPRVYINSLKHKLRSVNNINDIKDYIRMTLSDNAATWFASIENDLDNLQTFENQFLNYYWGELEQARFREVLYFGKYNRNLSLNMVDYALKLITVAKYLEPPLREDETVLNVSRHFDADVVQTVTVQNIQTVDSFINFIQRVQRGYITSNNSKNRQSYNNNRYGSNSHNFNNNNNTSYERQGNRENFNNNTNDNRQERQGNRENFNNNNYNRQDFNTRRNAQRYNYNRQVNYVRGQSCEDSQRNSTWQENMNSRSESSERHRELDPNDQTQSDNPNNPNFM
ncbi:GATA zinc finger domain-containing protein 4-like [Diabrotica virgifera virgifera]|uniref:Uncharacterized protein n=1 Tax=Diabrotica virgifera virgifera TaxID=50390 RepID=A0ABM5L1H5_DIAVI|nr:GATA zinc finger domain-containing protein 4-like [Diabrotica virgifera virgifera]